MILSQLDISTEALQGQWNANVHCFIAYHFGGNVNAFPLLLDIDTDV